MPELEFRFAVGSASKQRSGTWKIWSPRNKNDIYITCREMNGDFKISLHASGKFQASFSAEYEKKLREYGAWKASRHLEKWEVKRPVFQPVPVLRFYIPETELRQSNSQSHAQIQWIPAPAEGQTAVVEVVIAQENIEFTGLFPGSSFRMLFRRTLPSNEVLCIGHYVEQTSDVIAGQLREIPGKQGMKLDSRKDWDPVVTDGRIVLFGPNVGDWLSVLDAAGNAR